MMRVEADDDTHVYKASAPSGTTPVRIELRNFQAAALDSSGGVGNVFSSKAKVGTLAGAQPGDTVNYTTLVVESSEARRLFILVKSRGLWNGRLVFSKST
jgi:hypothetical protein